MASDSSRTSRRTLYVALAAAETRCSAGQVFGAVGGGRWSVGREPNTKTEYSHGRQIPSTERILFADGFEQVEMTEPRKVLGRDGADTHLVLPKADRVLGWQLTERGDEFPVDDPLDKATAQAFDSLVRPGGVINPDKPRMQSEADSFVKAIFDPASRWRRSAMGRGPSSGPARRAAAAWMSWPSLKPDVKNAGAQWADEAAVIDGKQVKSRRPDDLPARAGPLTAGRR